MTSPTCRSADSCPERVAPYPDSVILMKRQVSAELDVDIDADTTLDFQIAVAPHPEAEVSETLSFVLNGHPVQAREITGLHGNRIHKFDAHVGHLEVRYEATIVGQTSPAPVSDYDLSMYLWPSRYAEADKFYGFAGTEFGDYADSTTLLEKVSSWVGTRLNYVPGSSAPGRRIATRGQRSGAPGLRLRARPVTNGLPRSGGSVRRRALAGGRCDVPCTATDPRPYRHRA